VDIKRAVYETIHGKGKNVEEIADAIGCSPSLLYRCANINDPGARFPLERTLPLMNATRDFTILKHLAARSGFLLYRLPSKFKHHKTADLNKYQSVFIEAFQALVKFKDGEIDREACLEKIDTLLSRTIELRTSVERSDQMTLDFGD